MTPFSCLFFALLLYNTVTNKYDYQTKKYFNRIRGQIYPHARTCTVAELTAGGLKNRGAERNTLTVTMTQGTEQNTLTAAVTQGTERNTLTATAHQ